jgi:hypothetical protein
MAVCKVEVNNRVCGEPEHSICHNCKRPICFQHIRFHDIWHGGGAMVACCMQCGIATIRSEEERHRQQALSGLKLTPYISHDRAGT